MIKKSHHTVRQSIQDRIEVGEWPLGALIPGEIELASEYACARTTINRALQALADAGMVIRKRKGGTRVCEMPVRHAKFTISIVREQVEATGCQYQHRVITSMLKVPPVSVITRLNLQSGEKAFYLETLHLADDRPFAFEQRWVNLKAVPNILAAPLDDISANEWLVKTIPFSSGDVIFSAMNVDQKVATLLATAIGKAIFVVERTTWYKEAFITTMKLFYKDGFQLYTRL
jgi:GntR family histidine utilization transcriptional repressor